MPTFSFELNGEQVSVDTDGDIGLLYVMRDLLGVTGPKYGCGVGVCRACTCHLNGEEFQPCVTPVEMVDGQSVTSIEGLADGDTLHPLQQAWIDLDVAQCGYCQPGQIMTAAALLQQTSEPTDAQIDEIENVCRCGTYFRVREAIKQAASGGATTSTADSDTDAAPPPPDSGGDGLLGGLTGGVLGAAGAPVDPALPATGSGAGAAALITAAAAAVRRGRQETAPVEGPQDDADSAAHP